MKQITNDDLQQFITLWNKGYNCQQISLLMPLNKTTLYYQFYRVLKADNKIVEHKHGRPIANTRRYVQEAYLQGMTDVKQLADRFGVCENSIQQYLWQLNRREQSKEMQHEIAKQLQSGTMSQSDVAKLHGVSRQYVYQIKQELERYLV